MTRIRAMCPDCGEVELRPVEIDLRIVPGTAGDVGPGSHYVFDCPTCHTAVVKPADERIARLLATGGVEVAVEGVAGRSVAPERPVVPPPHPEAPAGGPPLTSDDLLDLHLALRHDDWFVHLRASVA